MCTEFPLADMQSFLGRVSPPSLEWSRTRPANLKEICLTYGMSVKTTIEKTEGIYFITFTCQHWLPLFQTTKSYDTVYKWFDYLETKGHYVRGYVIMPNHLHALVDFGASEKNINTIISNGKRFIAYEIVKRLKAQNDILILSKIAEAVTKSDKARGKIHQVFERSFDCKEISSRYFFMQKLSYMHNNPCSGIWMLVENPVDYIHSSAKYYLMEQQGIYLIKE